MSGPGRARSWLASLARLVVFAAVAGLVTAAVLPGGPVDLPRLDDGRGDGVGAGTRSTGDATTTETPVADRPSGPSPWGKEVLVVAVRNRGDPSRNVTGAVAEALEYWNRNGGYADYPASFVLRPDAAEPDVVVRYDESIDCPDHGEAIGCAPLIHGESRVEPPVTVQLRSEPTDNRRQVRNTAIHEFGHVLGITHCEEPHWVMASACTEPLPDAPDADERDLAWRDGTISVHVDYANVPAAERGETREQVSHALGYIENDTRGELPADVEFVRVESRFAADVSVTFLAEPECPEGAVVCSVLRGRDYDDDDPMEYYTNGEIRVEPGTDVSARGWYVGRALAHQLSPANVPEVFEEASYREQRSRWWE